VGGGPALHISDRSIVIIILINSWNVELFHLSNDELITPVIFAPRDDGRGVSPTAPTRPLGLVAAPTSPRRARRRVRRDVDRGRSAKCADGPVRISLRHLHDVDDLGSSGVSCIEGLGRLDAPPGTSRRHRENTTTELGFRVWGWRVSRLRFPCVSPWGSCRREPAA
jgi:hypothetical protein